MQRKLHHRLFARPSQLFLGLLLIIALGLSACTVDVQQLAGTALGDSIFLPIITNATENTVPTDAALAVAPTVEPAGEDVTAAFVIGGGGPSSKWVKVRGSLKNLSVGSDGTVWGVNEGNEIWQGDGISWTKIDGGLSQISVGSAAHIWGVNEGGEVWYRAGNQWIKTTSGLLRQVDVGCDGTVWGVNSSDQVWRWDGTRWHLVSTGMTQVAVGNASNIWGMGYNNEVFRWSGSNWVKIEGNLQQVDVGCDGTVWGIDSSNQFTMWAGDSPNPRWLSVSHLAAVQISAGSSQRRWLIGTDGALYYYRYY